MVASAIGLPATTAKMVSSMTKLPALVAGTMALVISMMSSVIGLPVFGDRTTYTSSQSSYFGPQTNDTRSLTSVIGMEAPTTQPTGLVA